MLRQCIAFAALLTFGLFVWAGLDVRDLARLYRHHIWAHYRYSIAWYLGLLFVNLTTILYAIGLLAGKRRTGQSLKHAERQLRAGKGINTALAERLEEAEWN